MLYPLKAEDFSYICTYTLIFDNMFFYLLQILGNHLLGRATKNGSMVARRETSQKPLQGVQTSEVELQT